MFMWRHSWKETHSCSHGSSVLQERSSTHCVFFWVLHPDWDFLPQPQGGNPPSFGSSGAGRGCSAWFVASCSRCGIFSFFVFPWQWEVSLKLLANIAMNFQNNFLPNKWWQLLTFVMKESFPIHISGANCPRPHLHLCPMSFYQHLFLPKEVFHQRQCFFVTIWELSSLIVMWFPGVLPW